MVMVYKYLPRNAGDDNSGDYIHNGGQSTFCL